MFTLLFVAFLLTDIAVRMWLASRQIRHVARNRDQVPAEFSHRIGLTSHQRAADYTVARVRLVSPGTTANRAGTIPTGWPDR